MRRRLLALDGGGTKTVCWLADETGTVLGAGRGGPVNVNFVPETEARASLRAAVAGALAEAGAPHRVDLVCAGATMSADLIQDTLRGSVDYDTLLAPGEPECCLASGSGDGWGAVILSGTGAFQWARGLDGAEHRTDGWGALLGDQGSGYDIARSGLVAAARAVDGRGPASSLPERFRAVIGGDELRSAARRLYREGWPRHRVAALCPIVAEAARDGDEVAGGVLRAAADALAGGVEVCARRVGLDERPFDLVLQGGVMRCGAPLLDPLHERLAYRLPTAKVVTPPHGPEAGALRLGLRALSARAAAGAGSRAPANERAHGFDWSTTR